MLQDGPSRRAVLVGAGLLVVAGCSAGDTPEPPEPDPDVAIRALALGGVQRLLQLYDAVSRAHEPLRAELAPLAAETAAHASALTPPAPGSTTPSPSPTPSPTVAAPPTVAGARRALARAERHEAQLRVSQLGPASPGLARLLAAIGASEATHATLLGAR